MVDGMSIPPSIYLVVGILTKTGCSVENNGID